MPPRDDILISWGETFERAQENLKEALALFIESCLSRGTLEAEYFRLLKEC